MVEINGLAFTKTEEQNQPHLIFLPSEQQVAGSTGCNRIIGRYDLLPDGSLNLGNLATTMMACPDMDIEAAFLEAFRQHERVLFESGSFNLQDTAGRVLARFQATPLPTD